MRNPVTHPLAYPVVNLNGTAGRDLCDQQRELWNALNATLKALANAAPHGRDYQTAGPSTYAQARAQHDARCAAVRQLLHDTEELWHRINDQLP